jgi:hypothetical protein
MAHYTDADYADFLKALNEAAIEVSDWEAKFIESNLETEMFSPRQVVSLNELIERYGKRIGWL